MKLSKTSVASVYLSDKGKYYVNYKDAEGVSRRKLAKGATTVSEAKRILQDFINEANDMRTKVIPMDISRANLKDFKTLNDLADKFFELRHTKNNKADKGRYLKWVAPYLGQAKHPISELQLLEFQNLLRDSLVHRGEVAMPMSAKTVNIIVNLATSVISWGIDLKLVRYAEGCPKVAKLLVDNERQRVLNVTEIEKLLAELDPSKAKPHLRDVVKRNKLIVMLGLFTGARPVSYLNLRKSDIVVDSDGYPQHIHFSARKGAKAYTVPVADDLKAILGSWIVDLKDNDLLFTWSYSSIQQSIGRVFDKLFNADVASYDIKNKVSLYTLRHSGATLIYNNTGDIHLVSSLLGHSNGKMATRYTKMGNATLTNGVNSIMGGSNGKVK